MKILHGDCRDKMRELEADSVDSIVTDPPYGLSFMGKGWDHGVPGVEFWVEALRVAKPGAYLLAFGGTRTFHRLAVAIEDAGWEIRDTVMWVYGSGFPKSHNISKAIDREAGAEREVIGEKFVSPKGISSAETRTATAAGSYGGESKYVPVTAPATDLAKQWDGWGTTLKPAWEPVIVARKPLDGTVAQNVLEWGTGAINIDGCRVEINDTDDLARKNKLDNGMFGIGNNNNNKAQQLKEQGLPPVGRWPANLIHDGSQEVMELFPVTGKSSYSKQSRKRTGFMLSGSKDNVQEANSPDSYGDSGSASRFFYCAKASKADRDEGLDGNNHHPTVKPTALMSYLCKLVTPPNGIILDPFMGSGSTGKAAIASGFDFIGIEQDEEYAKIAEARINNAKRLL